MISGGEKIVRLDCRLLPYCSQCSFRQIPGMIRDGCITIHLNVEPNLMTAGGLSIKTENHVLLVGG